MDVLKEIPDNSMDSVVTDPPYEYGFMNRGWDKTGIAYNVELWQECLRVLKPGGHLLAFGGTRTYHRMACAIEDAGFEIRDCIQWLYGSGFPKSHDISKAIDKKLRAEREKVRIPANKVRNPKSINGGHGIEGGDRPWMRADLEKGFHEMDGNIPATPEAKQWEGWGTALKPANEPIVLARKPISEKTIAENVLKWGVGAVNIDACRIYRRKDDVSGWSKSGSKESENIAMAGKNYARNPKPDNHLGRFPANIIFDEEAGCMLDEQSGVSRSSDKPRQNNNADNHDNYNCFGKYGNNTTTGYSDTGGASRFFYCAKASKAERNMGLDGYEAEAVDDGRNKPIDNPFLRGKTSRKNTHPTVKPLSLMQYLVRLVTPPGGVVLDPFAGSGSTLLAAEMEGFDSIGIELNPEYCEIARARLSAPMQMAMF